MGFRIGGPPQACGTTIDQAIALFEPSDAEAFWAAAVPAGTSVTSAVNEARLPPPVPLVVVRRVSPLGVVHVRVELDLSTQ